MKRLIGIYLILYTTCSFAQNTEKQLNVIYGDQHLYTIATPNGWVNNQEAAQSIGLTNYFYKIGEGSNPKRTYMYTNGYDKENSQETVETFLKADMDIFLKKYPDAKYEQVEIGFSPPLIGGIMLSYSNLSDRYKEEVVYLESPETIIVFSFAAFTEDEYVNYVGVFENEFISSFKYQGNDPKPYLDWLEKQK